MSYDISDIRIGACDAEDIERLTLTIAAEADTMDDCKERLQRNKPRAAAILGSLADIGGGPDYRRQHRAYCRLTDEIRDDRARYDRAHARHTYAKLLLAKIT